MEQSVAMTNVGATWETHFETLFRKMSAQEIASLLNEGNTTDPALLSLLEDFYSPAQWSLGKP